MTGQFAPSVSLSPRYHLSSWSAPPYPTLQKPTCHSTTSSPARPSSTTHKMLRKAPRHQHELQSCQHTSSAHNRFESDVAGKCSRRKTSAGKPFVISVATVPGWTPTLNNPSSWYCWAINSTNRSCAILLIKYPDAVSGGPDVTHNPNVDIATNALPPPGVCNKSGTK